jgi:hypothetical protein
MVLHFWVIPLLVLLGLAVWIFYMAVKRTGGPGIRTDGRTVVDKPVEDNDKTPSI